MWRAALFLSSVLPFTFMSAACPSPSDVSTGELPGLQTTLTAHDSLQATSDTDPDADACLDGFRWKPTQFGIRFEAAEENRGAIVVRFPAPRLLNSTEPDSSDVALEWYPSRSADGSIRTAPAIVVVHESGRGMTVGRLLSRGFAAQGLHAFLIHLPGYGRRTETSEVAVTAILDRMKQGIADTRRARDAVIALPGVDARCVGVQGTSLGGFVVSCAAALDDGFDRTFILLAGGNLHDVILEGKRDAAKVRQRLFAAGLSQQDVRDLTWPIEPLRVAHRMNPETTWLYSGLYDDVVPPKCCDALADAVGLHQSHHMTFPADHYSGVVFLPSIIMDVAGRVSRP